MIDLDDFIMVVRFLVRCAYDPYYEHHVDNELNNSPHLQKLVSTVKLFHSERLNALAKLRRTCPRNYFLDELFEIKRVRSFQSVPEGAVCLSGQPIRVVYVSVAQQDNLEGDCAMYWSSSSKGRLSLLRAVSLS